MQKNILTIQLKRKNLETNYKCKIQINPKIDSKDQRRVQCSITNFETILKKFIIYESPIECPNLLRGKKIKKIIESPKRKRNKKYNMFIQVGNLLKIFIFFLLK